MISKFNTFRENLLLESLINESFIYFSDDLRKIISKIYDRDKDEIAGLLADLETTNVKPDVTFLNLDKEGYLSFITSRNASKILSNKWPHTSEDEWFKNRLNRNDTDTIWKNHLNKGTNDVYAKSRNSIKLGKLINKLAPGKFTDKQIEEFVNKFKSTIVNSEQKFELVSGEDIDFWYQKKNYAEIAGTLGSSCMSGESGIFKIYTENPDVCRMLILKEDDKIVGRALVWKLESIKAHGHDLEKVKYFMDRQYTVKDSDVNKFRNFAKEQEGWVSKANNNHHSFRPIINHLNNDEVINVDMMVRVEAKDYESYPYVDTFRRYDHKNGTLHNDEESDSDYEGDYLLQDTNGGYQEIEGGYYSEYYDRMIPEDDAVYSDYLSTYLYRSDSWQVSDGSRRYYGWYPVDYDDVVYDEWSEIAIHINDAVYSEAYSYWILRENAYQVIEDIDEDGSIDAVDWYHYDDNDIIEIDTDMNWYDKLSDNNSEWVEYEYILDKLMVKDKNDDHIPKILAIDVYQVNDDNTNIEYLTEFDANVLGYEIDKDEKEVIDQYQYHAELEDENELTNLYRKMSNEWTKLNNQLKDKGQLRIKFKDFNEDDYLKELKRKAELYDDRLSDIENETYIPINDDIVVNRFN